MCVCKAQKTKMNVDIVLTHHWAVGFLYEACSRGGAAERGVKPSLEVDKYGKPQCPKCFSPMNDGFRSACYIMKMTTFFEVFEVFSNFRTVVLRSRPCQINTDIIESLSIVTLFRKSSLRLLGLQLGSRQQTLKQRTGQFKSQLPFDLI